MLAVGQADGAMGPLPQVVEDGAQRRLEPLDGYGMGLAPGDQPVAQGAVTGEGVVEAPVGVGQLVLVDGGGGHAVAALDLLDVGHGLAGQASGADSAAR